MLYFSRPLTEIHGCVLTAGDKQEDILRNVVRATKEALGRCNSLEQVRDVTERIHLYLALNSDLKWPREIKTLESVSSSIGLNKQLSTECFIKIVRTLNMWPFLIELVQFLPPDPCLHILNFVLNIEFAAEELILITGLILSAWQNPRFVSEDVLKSLISKFEKLATQVETRSSVQHNLSSLLNLLTLLQDFIAPSNTKMGKFSKYQNILFCDLQHESKHTEQPNHHLKDTDDLLVKSLMKLFKVIMNQISFDDWLQGAEISTAGVLNNSAGVKFWPDDSAESVAPSNMQMLIAHHQAVCCDLIKAGAELADTEVLQMLAATARTYERSLELDLDNLTLGEVVMKLENPNIQEWQSDAVVGHLIKEENAVHVFSQPKVIKNLARFPNSTKFQIRKILKFAFSNNFNCQQELIELSKLTFNEMDTEELSEIFKTFHADFGLSPLLKSETWEDRFVMTLNKYNNGDDAGVIRDVLLLAMEDGKQFLTSVLTCAEESSGNVKTCSGLLSQVSPLSHHITDSNMFLLTSQLIQMIYCNELKENQQNLFSLQLSLCQSMPDVCLQVCENILKHVTENFSVCVPTPLLDYTSNLQSTIEILSLSAPIEARLRFKITLVFGCFLNSLTTVPSLSEEQKLLKEKCFKIIEKIRGEDIILECILNRENFRDYESAELLREKNHQSHLKTTHDMNLDGVKGQLLGSICCLLPKDWNFICNSELSDLLPAIVMIAIMQQNETQNNFYSALRSLCSEFKLSWANLFHLIRLLPAIEVFEQKQLVWTSIINNLAKLLDMEYEKQDVRATLELLLVLGEEDTSKIQTVIQLLDKHY